VMYKNNLKNRWGGQERVLGGVYRHFLLNLKVLGIEVAFQEGGKLFVERVHWNREKRGVGMGKDFFHQCGMRCSMKPG